MMSNPTANENATAALAATEILLETVRSIKRNRMAAVKSGDAEALSAAIDETRAIKELVSKVAHTASEASMVVDVELYAYG